PAEGKAVVGVIGQADAEENPVPASAQYFQAAQRMIDGGLGSPQHVVGERERDRGLSFTVTVTDLAADGERLFQIEEGFLLANENEGLAEILRRPGFGLTLRGRPRALDRDPVRGDAVGPVVPPVEEREQRYRKLPGNIVPSCGRCLPDGGYDASPFAVIPGEGRLHRVQQQTLGVWL